MKCSCQSHKHCPNCNKKMRLSAKTMNGFCMDCMKLVHHCPTLELKGRRRCAVMNCENYSDQGIFVGDLYFSCHEFVCRGSGNYSQAYRNSLQIIGRAYAALVKADMVKRLDPTADAYGEPCIADRELANIMRGA